LLLVGVTSLLAQPTSTPSSAPTAASAITSDHRPAGRYVLWYDQPTTNWYAALPVGNGRMGAMVFGGATTEHLQLNEDTIWSGGRIKRARPSPREPIRKGRELVSK